MQKPQLYLSGNQGVGLLTEALMAAPILIPLCSNVVPVARSSSILAFWYVVVAVTRSSSSMPFRRGS